MYNQPHGSCLWHEINGCRAVAIYHLLNRSQEKQIINSSTLDRKFRINWLILKESENFLPHSAILCGHLWVRVHHH